MKAICISGGAVKGAWSLGCLKHLLSDLKIQYDLHCGISVGALNLAFLSMYPHGQEVECIEGLEKLWRGLKTSDIYDYWLGLPGYLKYIGYLCALWKPSIYDSSPLINLVRNNYSREKVQQSGKKLQVGAVSLNTGKYCMFDQDSDDIIDAILASSSFPGAFLPIEIDNQLWTDGGVKEITPLKAAINSGATSIDVIVSSPESAAVDFGKDINIIKLGPRIIDIMSDEIQDNDLEQFLRINEFILNGAVIPGKKYIPIRIFRPQDKLVDSSLKFEQDIIGPLIDKGYLDAQRIVSEYDSLNKA